MVVWKVGDPGTPPKGTGDPEILLWCEEKGFSLVTHNRASMPVHLADHLAKGHHVPGLFILRRATRIGDLIEDLALIWEVAEFDEYMDMITYLPLT